MQERSDVSLGKHNRHYLLNERHRKRIPGHYSMVHQLNKGRQGERQHVSKAGKHGEVQWSRAQHPSTKEGTEVTKLQESEYKQNCTRRLGYTAGPQTKALQT